MSRQDRAYALRRPAGEHRRSCPARAAGQAGGSVAASMV